MAAAPNGVGIRIVKLTKPIVGHQGPIHELKLNPLTARVMMKHKRQPFKFTPTADGRLEVEVDFDMCGKYAADLSGIDETILEDMSADDFGKVIVELQNMVLGVGN